ncbi:Hypothetical protein NTJ_04194 [Nesidiocoris tenuis]|uniref:Uncharacterized protein n=1 Tax=Nesidiocoris tenuis TaxID=355587 RepID=A0ABN7AGK0_9HEMI|nr:Hypothetical protein NTJ_04194 [Nesidiocoris tenuis]
MNIFLECEQWHLARENTAQDGASGDALEVALMQQLSNPKRELTSKEHSYLAIAKDTVDLPGTARMEVRMVTLKALGGTNEKINGLFYQRIVEHEKVIAEFETVL